MPEAATTTYQSGKTLSSSTGSVPIEDGTVSGWDFTGPTYDDWPDETPLDPWGNCYGLAWSDSDAATAGEDVMIIYSAGPDGKLSTGVGAVNAGDKDADGTEDAGEDWDACDDLLYKFK